MELCNFNINKNVTFPMLLFIQDFNNTDDDDATSSEKLLLLIILYNLFYFTYKFQEIL